MRTPVAKNVIENAGEDNQCAAISPAEAEKLFQLCNRIRSAHWHGKKFHSRESANQEYRLGLQLDKLLREENTRRKHAEKSNVNG